MNSDIPTIPGVTPQDRLQRIVDAYETLSPATVPMLAALYAADARFKDPFNDIEGRGAIARVFEHMFAQVSEPRFVIGTRVAQCSDAFLTWEMDFRMARLNGVQTLRGATHLRFDEHGLIALHRDYWDAAEELYEKLPLVGGLMRLLKRRIAP